MKYAHRLLLREIQRTKDKHAKEKREAEAKEKALAAEKASGTRGASTRS